LSLYEQIRIPNHFLEGNTTGTDGKDAQKFSVVDTKLITQGCSFLSRSKWHTQNAAVGMQE